MINIKKYIKERTIQEVNVVHVVISAYNDYLEQDGWGMDSTIDWSEIKDVLFYEGMKDIQLGRYYEYDNDANISIDFININNKKLEDFNGLVDEIGKYIYNIRKGKKRISTVDEITTWLNKNIEALVNKYR